MPHAPVQVVQAVEQLPQQRLDAVLPDGLLELLAVKPDDLLQWHGRDERGGEGKAEQ